MSSKDQPSKISLEAKIGFVFLTGWIFYVLYLLATDFSISNWWVFIVMTISSFAIPFYISKAVILLINKANR
ncbi:MAG: hypothetical protein WD357_08130 [Gracilimonas sp.]